MFTQEQKLVYDSILAKEHRVTLLQGDAGTGKSYLISKIVENFKGSIVITATTNKAKNLLKRLTGKHCYTTQSACGFRMARNGLEEYLVSVTQCQIADLFIVDEVSMLTNEVYQKLLASDNQHILLVGDEAQLPAIGLKASLSNVDKVFTLKKQMRQSEDLALKGYLLTLRECITDNSIFKLRKNTPTSIALYDSHKEFCLSYNRSKESKRVLAYSNRVINSYNLNINNRDRFQVGDLLTLEKPLYSIAKNGDIVEVIKVDEQDTYYALTVDFEGVSSDIIVFKTKTLKEKYLNKYRTDNIEKYWYEMDKIFEPKHIYASTIHKAQGQSIDEVFIDVSDILAQTQRVPNKFNNFNKPITAQEFMKLLYVAISRMRKKAHLYIGTKRDYKHLKKGETDANFIK